MKSPVKDYRLATKATPFVKEMIPPGSVVDIFNLYAGDLEISLAESGRFVVAHTERYVIHEFWECLMSNPKRIAAIVSKLMPIGSEQLFNVLQETWSQYRDPYVRSALFFILNRCSDGGLVSSGKLDESKFTPLVPSYLKNFKIDNMHISLESNRGLIKSIESAQGDYLLLPMGKFSYNFFDDGKSRGHESTILNHSDVCETLKSINKKWIVMYEPHKKAEQMYKDFNITYLDKYGQKTLNKDAQREMIVANY